MAQRMPQSVDDGALLDQALDNPLLAHFIDVNDADMAELAIDVSYSSDRRTVVMEAANKQHIAGTESRQVVCIERRRHDGIDRPGKGF